MSKGKITGRYTVVATAMECLAAEGDKHEQLLVTLREVEGTEGTVGAEHVWFGSLHPNAAEYTLKGLRCLGWRGHDITKAMEEGLGSTKAIAIEKETTYKGKTRRRVEGIWELKAPVARVSETDASDFNAKFKALAAQLQPVEVSDENKAPDELPEVCEPSKEDLPSTDEENPFA